MTAALERLSSNPLIRPSQIAFTRASGTFNPGAAIDHAEAAVADRPAVPPVGRIAGYRRCAGARVGGDRQVGRVRPRIGDGRRVRPAHRRHGRLVDAAPVGVLLRGRRGDPGACSGAKSQDRHQHCPDGGPPGHGSLLVVRAVSVLPPAPRLFRAKPFRCRARPEAARRRKRLRPANARQAESHHAAAAALGSSIQKRQPNPTRDSTPTVPPCVSTMRLTVARPRPSPGCPASGPRT